MSDFAQRLSAHLPALRRYARALTRGGERAEDLVQDCLARAWERRGSWQPDRPLRPWLFTILHHLNANAARRYHGQPHTLALEDGDAVAASEGAESSARLAELQLAIEMLPEGQRHVLLLVGLEQLSYQEAAEVLGVPIGTVMSRLHRARERLRATLNAEPGPRLRSVT